MAVELPRCSVRHCSQSLKDIGFQVHEFCKEK